MPRHSRKIVGEPKPLAIDSEAVLSLIAVLALVLILHLVEAH